MADVIVLIDDLFFQAKLLETAKQTGTTLESVATGDQLVKSAAANPASLIIVDLNARLQMDRATHAGSLRFYLMCRPIWRNARGRQVAKTSCPGPSSRKISRRYCEEPNRDV